MKNTQTWRFKDVFGYLFLLGIGAGLGVIYGHLLTKWLLYLLSPDQVYGFLGHPQIYPHIPEHRYVYGILEGYDWISTALESDVVVTACYRCGEGFGAFSLGGQVVQSQSKYYELSRLKLHHRLTFFQIREMNAVLHNPLMDMAWSMSYVLAEIFLPPALCLGIGVLVAQVLWESIHGFSLIPAIGAAWWLSSHIDSIIYKLFHRFDLEHDLEDAPLMLAALADMQEEAQILSDGEVGEDIYEISSDDPALIFYAEEQDHV